MTAGRWEQIERIYQEAAAKPAAERALFLEKACAGDAELRTEVERMLSCGSEAGGFLESPAVEVAARALAEGPGGISSLVSPGAELLGQIAPPEFIPGKVLSHYRIETKLGEGGMGVVYKAEDTRLRRTVALKFLSPELLGDAEMRARHVREAQAAGALDHPNVCTVHGIEDVEGKTFIVMGYVDGESLKQRMQTGEISVSEALDIAIQAGEGLQQAHERGIVHRDIKSANLLVTAKGTVKICDFGLAQLAERSRITQPGTLLGTFTYISPEQATGRRVDRRADIWSLGVVLYEMLTDRCPFAGTSARSIIQAILREQPAPATSLRPHLPAELDWIFGKALAKDPAERYQYIDDLLVDLRAVRQRLSEHTGTPSAGKLSKAPGATAPLESSAKLKNNS
jgi:eukaryotic-like serine/threonine-protein kinase